VITAAVATVALFPLYLWIRRPYQALPLYIDTGFYVSNHTIATGSFDFSKGWNARYAGCCKALPELFYSLIYLTHCRNAEDPGLAYRRCVRLYASLYNYVTAIIVGLLAVILTGGGVALYLAALILFAAVSSEPQHGVYYECAELFGLLANALAVATIALGLTSGQAWWVGLGAFVWMLDACFIKLSSALAMVIVLGAVCIRMPSALLPIVLGLCVGGAAFAAWIFKNGQNPLELFGPLAGHESSFGQKADLRIVLHRLREKLRGFAVTVRSQPLIPMLAAGGVIVAWPGPALLWIYLAGVFAGYVAQSTDCWYYRIRLLPPLALFAAPAAVALAASGFWGAALLAAAGLLWLYRNAWRPRRMSIDRLTAWCWNGQAPHVQLMQARAIESAIPALRETVGHEPVLVYGPFNQLYAMMGTSYATPLVAPEHYLDDMAPSWQQGLNHELVASPPRFILDSGACFDAGAAREKLGLDYSLVGTFAGRLRLFRFECRNATTPEIATARTFRALSSEELATEAKRSASPIDGPGDPTGATATDPAAEELQTLLRNLARAGYRRVGVYGAGRFTIRHADVYRRSPVPIVAVFDDRPERHGGTFLDWPIARLDEADPFELDALVVSTDRFADVMQPKARRLTNAEIPVFCVTDEPHPCPSCVPVPAAIA